MTARALLVAATALAWTAPPEEACGHGRSGGAIRVSLDRVARAQRNIRERLELSVASPRAVPVEPRFESGLPACRRSLTRRVAAQVPAPLVGKTIAFGPQGRIPEADLEVATTVRSLRRGGFDAVADPAMVRRLGVRCFPSIVTARSAHELEIRERP